MTSARTGREAGGCSIRHYQGQYCAGMRCMTLSRHLEGTAKREGQFAPSEGMRRTGCGIQEHRFTGGGVLRAQILHLQELKAKGRINGVPGLEVIPGAGAHA